jgi:predicted nucleic acid-binding Zn ribbon protein
MPRYDYECQECGQVLEIEHSIKADAVKYQSHFMPDVWVDLLSDDDSKDAERRCYPCDGKLKRLVGTPMFNFKGGAPTPKFS